MTKVTYINEMEIIYTNHARSHYLVNGGTTYRNHGEVCESIAKFHRGIFTENNPNTAWNEGSDIESEHAEVKSSEAGLGRGIGGYENTASDKIKTYFREAPADKKWIWVEWNAKTNEVTEYHMNKSEFGKFIREFTRVHNMSNHKEVCIRFKKSSKKMVKWLERNCA